MMEDLKKYIEVNELYKHYHPLLTDKQRLLMTYYYQDDYSLSEIADLENISRNAVHDLLKRAVKKLYNYESKLQLHNLEQKRYNILKTLKKSITDESVLDQLEELEKVE